MKTYPVHESEMEMIGSLDLQTNVFFGGATLFVGFAVSIWIAAAFAPALAKNGIVFSYVVAPLCLVMAALLGVLGTMAWFQKRGLWQKIKSDSEPVSVRMGARGVAVTGPVDR